MEDAKALKRMARSAEKMARSAEKLARDLAEEYACLGKILDQAERIAAEFRRRADAEYANAKNANETRDGQDEFTLEDSADESNVEEDDEDDDDGADDDEDKDDGDDDDDGDNDSPDEQEIYEQIFLEGAEDTCQAGTPDESANKTCDGPAPPHQAEGANAENKSKTCDGAEPTRQAEAHDDAEPVSMSAKDLRDLIDDTAAKLVSRRKTLDSDYWRGKDLKSLRDHILLISLRSLVPSKPRIEHSFPQFGLLPPELRIMIWKAAMPDKHRVWVDTYHPQRFIMPTIGHVCRESRDVVVEVLEETKVCACRDAHVTDRKWFEFPSEGDGTLRRWAGPLECVKHPTSFNPHQGMVILPKDNYHVYGRHPRSRRPLLAAAQEIVIDFWSGSDNFQHRHLYDDVLRLWDMTFSELRNKNISFMGAWHPTLFDRQWTPPHIVDELFRGEAYFMLDLTDHAELPRVAALMEQFQAFWPDHKASFDEILGCGPSGIRRLSKKLVTEEVHQWWSNLVQVSGRIRSHLIEQTMSDNAIDLAAAERLIKQSNIQIRPIHIFVLVDPEFPDSSNRWWRHYHKRPWGSS